MLSIKIAALCVVLMAVGVQSADFDLTVEDPEEAMCLIGCSREYPILIHPCGCARRSACRMGCHKDDEVRVDILGGNVCQCRKPWKVLHGK
ncbi:hypothetical protein DdX_12582 [Ditylenchus destructor]|uniref:Uncharacterized protein n=1 Tax=Ditylenchus destructor TaxID=166010 RepID=A0AAD4N0G9_9BILA|nr:hypothetical protein DdX_12582 [Ditylenchus destructor]